MTRNIKRFEDREPREKQWILENTWCNVCHSADLGMTDPVEYEEDGMTLVEGKCKRCSSTVRSEIQTMQDSRDGSD